MPIIDRAVTRIGKRRSLPAPHLHSDVDGISALELAQHEADYADGEDDTIPADDDRRRTIAELSRIKPSVRLGHDTILAALGPHIKRKLVSGHHLCAIVHVPNDSWSRALLEAFRYVLMSVSVEMHAPVSNRSDYVTAETDRYRAGGGYYVGVDRLTNHLTSGHVIVCLIQSQPTADIGMVRGVSDIEISFDPTADLAGIESVIDHVHPAFQWPAHLPLDELSPKVLDLAVKRAADRRHLTQLLERLLPAAQAEEKASAEGIARLERENEASSARSAARDKERAGGLVQILRPTSPRLEDLKGYGKLAAWAKDLLIDLLAYRTQQVAWSDIDGGCLIAGPPGTGKTLFASALAASADLPLIVFSYADAQSHGDGHLGTVIKRIRAVFAEAAKAAPCVLFIDELDAFSRRSSGMNQARHDDWWTAIIACLLELLDGTARREGVVVIGATNYAEKIDPAILRSGRLDRRFDIDLPDAEALTGIFQHHLPDVPADAFEPAAVALAGSISGADVARYAREARRLARRADRPLSVEDLMSIALPPDTRSPQKARMIAVHEAGHAVAYMTLGRILRSISLVSSGGIGGHVMVMRDYGLMRQSDLEGEVIGLLAGRAAEDVVFGIASAGAGGEQGDLGEASKIVGQMIGELGLAGKLVVHRPDNALVESELQRLDFEAERWRLLVEHADGMPVRFDELCRQTAPHVGYEYRPRWDRPGWPSGLPTRLEDAWLDWAAFWPAFVRRNPRIDLTLILGDIARAVDGSDWPFDPRFSDALRVWTRSGFTTPRPFDDPNGITHPVWLQELWDAAQAAGQGWPLWDAVGEVFVWVEDRHFK